MFLRKNDWPESSTIIQSSTFSFCMHYCSTEIMLNVNPINNILGMEIRKFVVVLNVIHSWQRVKSNS